MQLIPQPVVLICTTILLFFITSGVSIGEDLQWYTSKQQAFEIAEQQGKKVLLLAGRDT